VVWLFTPDKKDLVVGLDESAFEVKRTRVFRPGHNTPRIIAQSGWFTVHKWRPADERFIALESNKLYKSVLYRIDVPKASFPGIREELARLDIHSASMFPDLGGLGTHVEWRYIRDSDE
jgi:hypothetical protein